VSLVPDLTADECGSDRRYQRDREQRGEAHGEGLGKGERREEAALGSLQREHGKKPDGDHEQREEDRAAHLLERLQHHLGTRLLRAFVLPPQ